MKVCVTSTGPNLDSLTDLRFGRAQYFLILDEKGNLKKALANPAIEAIRGAGVAAAQRICSEKVDVLITGNIGPNAWGVLTTTKIKIFLVKPGPTAKEAFLMWKEDKLTQVEKPTLPGCLGRGFGRGLGRRPGLGRGRGRGPGSKR